MLCTVLLCRLSVGDSLPPKDTGVSGQCRQSSPWEGEAPAEPKCTVSVQLSLFTHNRSPGIPDARDKSRSLGFSPGTNFASPLKSPVFF
jgi:hypothetical protein